MSFTGSPSTFHRSPSVQAKLKTLFDEAGGDSGVLKVSDIKKSVTGEKNALKYDWNGAGLVRNKVIEALEELSVEGEDREVTFAEFWDVITGNAAKPRLDPLVEAQHYLARHKLVTLIENMAASILYEKPDDPRQFLIQKLTALRATGEEPHHFTDDDLTAMFGMFDVSGRGVVTASQTNEAVKVLTGVDGDQSLLEDPGRPIKMEEFSQHARVALANQLGAVAVAPSR